MLLFFFNDTATTEIYTLSRHDALPIWPPLRPRRDRPRRRPGRESDPPARLRNGRRPHPRPAEGRRGHPRPRSEEHTSELQSRQYLVCRLLLEKQNDFVFPVLSGV